MIKFFFMMLWFHFFDDYFLQGCLANLKQRSWWKEHADNNLYKHDYLMALFCHSMMWSCSIMIPTLISNNFIWWLIPINCIIHLVVDNLKANAHKINLIIDQLIHFLQIVLTFILCYLVF